MHAGKCNNSAFAMHKHSAYFSSHGISSRWIDALNRLTILKKMPKYLAIYLEKVVVFNVSKREDIRRFPGRSHAIMSLLSGCSILQ